METAIGLIIGAGILTVICLLAVRTTRKPQAVYLPAPTPQPVPIVVVPQRAEPMKSIVDPNAAAVMMGLGQQISSLGTNEAIDIEHTWNDSGQKVRFCKLALPPMVKPLLSAPSTEDSYRFEQEAVTRSATRK